MSDEMFDYLRCDAPLPDRWRPQDGFFQTEDLGGRQRFCRISVDGRLLIEEQEQPDQSGSIEMFAVETIGHRPDGEAISRPRRYFAEFSAGRLQRITGGPEPI